MDKDESDELLELISYFKFYIKELDSDINILIKLLNKTLMKSKIKNFTTNNLFSIKINNILIFKELEQNYQFFKNLSSLNINVKTTNCTFQEFIFLIHSYKFLRK